MVSKIWLFEGNLTNNTKKTMGIFLKLTKLFAMFDPFMKSHIQRELYKRNSVHYLYKDSQNKSLEILSDDVIDKI